MEINGLPLHAVVLHGAVVLGPIAALLALVYLVPRSREWARWPMVATALLAAAFVVITFISGKDLLDSNPSLRQIPEVATHEDRALWALVVTLVFAVIAVAAGLLHRSTGAVRMLLSALVGVGAVATVVAVVATGDAGAQAVWGGR